MRTSKKETNKSEEEGQVTIPSKKYPTRRYDGRGTERIPEPGGVAVRILVSI